MLLGANPVLDLVEDADFQSALLWGLAGLGVSVAAGLVWRRLRKGRPAPAAGLAIAAAGLLTLRYQMTVPDDLRDGLLLLAIAGLIADLFRHQVLIGAVLALPGAVLVSNTVPERPSWSEALVIGTIVMGGVGAAVFDMRHAGRGLGPPLFAISCVGVYFTTPDTEHAVVLVGAALPLALSSFPIPFARLGTAGAFAATGLLAWTAATDGIGRESSIVGAVACLGLLVAEPLARFVRRPRAAPTARTTVLDRFPNTWQWALAAGSVQLGLVYLASRVAGLETELADAVRISAATLGGAVAVCAVFAPKTAGDGGDDGG